MSKFSLSSVVAILAAGKALADDVRPLFSLVGQAMETVETALASASGADKKTAVLNIVSLAAAELGHDFGTIATEVSLVIDGAKTLYNAVAAVVKPAGVAVSAPRPQAEPL